MSRLRGLCLLVGFAAVVLAVGTGSFSASTSDRSVSVDVVDDEDAILGLVAEQPERAVGPNGTRTHSDVPVLTVTNRFNSPIASIRVTVVSAETPTAVSVEHVEFSADSLGPGEAGTVDATVTCADAGTASVTVRIEAESESASVETTRTAIVECRRSSR
jgi:uncharacterized membrane protein